MCKIWKEKQDKDVPQGWRQTMTTDLYKGLGAFIVALLLASPVMGFGAGQAPKEKKVKWKLVWEEQFKGDNLDESNWTVIDTEPDQYKKASDWNRHMIDDSAVYEVKEGSLYLKAINNTDRSDDPRQFLTAGVRSQGKFAFLYGKVEIRARKECAQGAWPALWMMPDRSAYGGWPHSGEIDIMEHLNFDKNIHHTVHTRYTNVLDNKTNPPRSRSDVMVDDITNWNIYGLEWYPDKLVWTVNGKETFSYPRVEGLDPELRQWPYDQPFYFILSQQLGGSWVGEVIPEHLPVSFIIDYVKVYRQK